MKKQRGDVYFNAQNRKAAKDFVEDASPEIRGQEKEKVTDSASLLTFRLNVETCRENSLIDRAGYQKEARRDVGRFGRRGEAALQGRRAHCSGQCINQIVAARLHHC